jgi:hypothetical protein
MRWLPVASLALLVLVVLRMKPFVPGPEWPREKKPVLALELPYDDGEVRQLLGSCKATMTALQNTRWDYWFIAAYTLLFLSIAPLHQGAWRMGMVLVAVAAAAFDVWEDAVIMKFIAHPDLAVARDVWFPARAKWLCFFAAVMLVAPLFARAGRWWWIAAGLLAACGLAGAVASLVCDRKVIGAVTDPAVAVLAVAVLLLPFVARR